MTNAAVSWDPLVRLKSLTPARCSQSFGSISSVRLTSRNGWGLSRPNLNLNGTKPWGGVSLAVVQSEPPVLLSSWRELFFGFTLLAMSSSRH